MHKAIIKAQADYVMANARRAGMNHSELAEAAGLSRQALYRRLHGETPWSIDEGIRLLDAVGMPHTSLYNLSIEHREA